METLVAGILGAVAALVAAWIGYLAALRATNKQIVKLVEQLETAKRQLDVDAVGMTSCYGPG